MSNFMIVRVQTSENRVEKHIHKQINRHTDNAIHFKSPKTWLVNIWEQYDVCVMIPLCFIHIILHKMIFQWTHNFYRYTTLSLTSKLPKLILTKKSDAILISYLHWGNGRYLNFAVRILNVKILFAISSSFLGVMIWHMDIM